MSWLRPIIEVLLTRTAHHVVRKAVDVASERMNTPGPRESRAADLEAQVSALNQRIAAAEQRAAAAEELLTALQSEMQRKTESVRIWILVLLAWNLLVTATAIYLLVRR